MLLRLFIFRFWLNRVRLISRHTYGCEIFRRWIVNFKFFSFFVIVEWIRLCFLVASIKIVLIAVFSKLLISLEILHIRRTYCFIVFVRYQFLLLFHAFSTANASVMLLLQQIVQLSFEKLLNIKRSKWLWRVLILLLFKGFLIKMIVGSSNLRVYLLYWGFCELYLNFLWSFRNVCSK